MWPSCSTDIGTCSWPGRRRFGCAAWGLRGGRAFRFGSAAPRCRKPSGRAGSLIHFGPCQMVDNGSAPCAEGGKEAARGPESRWPRSRAWHGDGSRASRGHRSGRARPSCFSSRSSRSMRQRSLINWTMRSSAMSSGRVDRQTRAGRASSSGHYMTSHSSARGCGCLSSRRAARTRSRAKRARNDGRADDGPNEGGWPMPRFAGKDDLTAYRQDCIVGWVASAIWRRSAKFRHGP